ncbi:MAG TPA: hypothetical protein VF902_09715 [Coriobacteriia bacterium]
MAPIGQRETGDAERHADIPRGGGDRVEGAVRERCEQVRRSPPDAEVVQSDVRASERELQQADHAVDGFGRLDERSHAASAVDPAEHHLQLGLSALLPVDDDRVETAARRRRDEPRVDSEQEQSETGAHNGLRATT